MFLNFYGLNEQPFGVTPDPKYVFWGNSHREAMASLFYGIESGCGFMTLIAPPGMGKTTLLFHLLDRLGDSCRTAYIFETQCNSSQLLRYLMADLGCDSGEQDRVALYAKLYELLIAEARAGKRFVLIVDEAQNLDDSVLETVRLLSNFETPSRKLMQVVLAGQPQLAEKLSREELSQLRQRVSIMSRIEPLTASEVTEYIRHRLEVAGYTNDQLFTAEALQLIASASKGIPRTINNLCFNALSLGFAQRSATIPGAIIQEVISDLALEETPEATAIPVSPVEARVPLAKAPVSQVPRSGLNLSGFWTAVGRHLRRDSAQGWLAERPRLRFVYMPGWMTPRRLAIATSFALLLLVVSYSVSLVNGNRPAAVRASLSSPAAMITAGRESGTVRGPNSGRGGMSTIRYMTVTVGPDGNLDYISRRYLGKRPSPRTMGEMVRINPHLEDPRRIPEGDRICLPLSEARVIASAASLRRGTSPEPELQINSQVR